MKPNIGKGDKGETDLLGKRISKCDCRVEACGSIDELNSFIGLIRSTLQNRDIDSLLEKIQSDLFLLGSDLISKQTKISEANVKFLERMIEQYEIGLPTLKGFVLPAGSQTASLLHVARTVCRRAERNIVALSKKRKINPKAIAYVNRLSDLLFTLARVVNKRAGVSEKEI